MAAQSHSPQFGCFTIPNHVFLSDIDSNGLPNRQRKVHAKSRYGCENCKERKVKVSFFNQASLIKLTNPQCDESQPCGNCRKRNDKCSFITPGKARLQVKKGLTSSKSTKRSRPSFSSRQKALECPLSPPLHLHLPPINLQHLQLFHAFETLTYDTFIFDPGMWKSTLIELALEVRR
jgi:hypothetical protein